MRLLKRKGYYLLIKTVKMYTKYSFLTAVILVAALILIVIVSTQLPSDNTGGVIIPPFLIITITASILGSYFAIRSFREKTNYKKVVGIVVNFGVLILIVALVVTNLMDIGRVF